MSDVERESPPTVTSSRKPPRTLACVLCQQRKVKCDRKFPCNTCIKTGVQCVPVAAPRQRRRRFPEGELLQRVRHLEDLLRQNNIEFEPLHATASEKNALDGAKQTERSEGASPEVKTETTFEAKFHWIEGLTASRNLWHAMSQKVQPNRGLSLMEKVLIADDQQTNAYNDYEDDEDNDDDEDLRDVAGKKTWDQMYKNSTDYLLFGSRIVNIDLSTLHPDHVQIFKFWQIYLENVNPLLKVTHTPTLQVRLINATADLKNVEPNLKALMFSVYCVAVMSVQDEDCLETFGFAKEELLQRYRFGCQQALLKCGFLQSDDRDCLTALFLYLVAVRPDSDPRSLSSLLGLAIRMAQRMGMDNESSNAKHGPLEGEMRRRLWWALLLFDNRVCEMSDYRAATLSPAWNCKTPANLNDFDLQPEMKHLPQSHERPTETTLAILRYQVADLVRHSPFFLDFTNPSLKSIANPNDHGGTLEALQQKMEETCLQYCNTENPLQFMTLWLTRGHLARYRLFQHFSIPPSQQTPLQRDSALTQALTMLDCDTIITTSPLTKKHIWFLFFHFPFPAYIHILQYLKREPLAAHAEKCWRTMSESCKVRFSDPQQNDHPFHKTPIFKVFARIIVKAWEARVSVLRVQGKVEETPFIVSEVTRMVEVPGKYERAEVGMSSGQASSDTFGSEDLMPFPVMGMTPRFNGFEVQEGFDFGGGGGNDGGMIGNGMVDVDMGALDLSAVDWSSLNIQGL
ncbi:hypothetical protein D6C78_00302 [Aureobasidium pullulans]|uniref:Zn(2)-C6 fungal-type domain-containing protein n=1 Tax=Aureobasidium pullulans TaxID=5580 RepID=A0A4T0C7K1_AURPU|nr:hypothetical protein D6C78_00302 [Aureobasidium pullulans]